ncbi:MAG: O-antigen ligase family protein [Thermaceae bacterium]
MRPLLLALAPLFPPLALFSLLALPHLRRLSRLAQALLFLYALSLLLPALFAPHPLALPLAVFRLVYALGLVGLGVHLGRQALPHLGYGLFATYLLALATTVYLFGDQAGQVRLLHPFHSPVGLGLLGAVGVLLALYHRYPLPFRVLLFLSGGAVLLLSGSRGGMLALLLGGLGGVMAGFGSRAFRGVGAALLLLGLAYFTENPVSDRFFSAHLSGREGLWYRAVEVVQAHPWTGVGPYVLGQYLQGVSLGCFLFPAWEVKGFHCSGPLLDWGGLWVFAHNHLLQALGESGVWGALGLALLVGGFLAGALGDGFLFSLLLGFVAMGMVDNPFSIPSPFRGEVFFIAGGMALARGIRMEGVFLLSGLAVLLWASPFLYAWTRALPPPPRIAYAAVDGQGGVVRLSGVGRAQAWVCEEGGSRCQKLGWEVPLEGPLAFALPEDLPSGRYEVRVLVFHPHRLLFWPRYEARFEVVR